MDASANSRKETWLIAIRMANEHPILGLGVRCSTLLTQQYGADMEGRAIHSQYLQTAADCGWVGLALFLGLLTMSVWQMTVFFRRTRHWPRYPEVMRARAIAGAVVCSLMVYAVGGVFLSLDNFEMPYVLFLISAQMFGIYKAGGIEALVWNSLPAHVRDAQAPARPVIVPGYGPIHPRRPTSAPTPAPTPTPAVPG
jgi:O-antigen ligase